jgi:hypothetical protein
MTDEGGEKNYRVFVHHGSTKDLYPNAKSNSQPNSTCGVREVYHLATIEEAENFYGQLFDKYKKKNGFKEYHIISEKIGSDLLPLSAFFSRFSTNSILPHSVQKLVSTVGIYLIKKVSLKDSGKLIITPPTPRYTPMQINV